MKSIFYYIKKLFTRKVMRKVPQASPGSAYKIQVWQDVGNERVPKLRFAIGCGYVLCGCGSVRLPISKSRLQLPQIGGYLVGYRLLDIFIEFYLF